MASPNRKTGSEDSKPIFALRLRRKKNEMVYRFHDRILGYVAGVFTGGLGRDL
jgi:hypothetical protein